MRLPSTYRGTIPSRIQRLIFKNGKKKKKSNETHRWRQDTGPVENLKFYLMKKDYKIEEESRRKCINIHVTLYLE